MSRQYVDLGSLAKKKDGGYYISVNSKVDLKVNGQSLKKTERGDKVFINADKVSDVLNFLESKGNDVVFRIVQESHASDTELRVSAKTEAGDTITLGKMFKTLSGNFTFEVFNGVDLEINGTKFTRSSMRMEPPEVKLGRILKGDEGKIQEELEQKTHIHSDITALLD